VEGVVDLGCGGGGGVKVHCISNIANSPCDFERTKEPFHKFPRGGACRRRLATRMETNVNPIIDTKL